MNKTEMKRLLFVVLFSFFSVFAQAELPQIHIEDLGDGNFLTSQGNSEGGVSSRVLTGPGGVIKSVSLGDWVVNASYPWEGFVRGTFPVYLRVNPPEVTRWESYKIHVNDSVFDTKNVLVTPDTYLVRFPVNADGLFSQYGANFHIRYQRMDGGGEFLSMSDYVDIKKFPPLGPWIAAPTAVVNVSYAGTGVGTVVTLDGSMSFDPVPSDKLSFKWFHMRRGPPAYFSCDSCAVTTFVSSGGTGTAYDISLVIHDVSGNHVVNDLTVVIP